MIAAEETAPIAAQKVAMIPAALSRIEAAAEVAAEEELVKAMTAVSVAIVGTDAAAEEIIKDAAAALTQTIADLLERILIITNEVLDQTDSTPASLRMIRRTLRIVRLQQSRV